jgi:hypothetical protein
MKPDTRSSASGQGIEAEPGPADQKPEELEGEVQMLREELGDLVEELDRRRQEAFDWRAQARRHSGMVAGVAAVAGVALASGLILRARQRRRRRSFSVRAQNLAGLLAWISEHPERVLPRDARPGAESQGAMRGILATAGTLAARALVTRALNQARHRRR